MELDKAEVMESIGHDYNYDTWRPKNEEYALFQSIARPGERAPDFVLPSFDGGELSLSSLKGQPVVIEFGSIT